MDPDTPLQSIYVHFYLDGQPGQGKFIASINANLPRPDVNQALKVTGDHGFGFYIPQELKDGKTHTLYAYAIDSNNSAYNSLITNSPKSFKFDVQTYPNTGEIWMFSYPPKVADFKELFTQPERWQDARANVDVITVVDGYFYPGWMQNNFPTIADRAMNDDEIKNMVLKMKSWDMDLAFESGVIKGWGCTGDITSAATKISIDRIVSNGGEVKYIAMDEPFAAIGPATCNYDMEKALDETIRYIKLIKAKYPNIIIGDIEAWPYLSKDQLKQWIIRFREKAGYELPFFHLDVDYAAVRAGNKNVQDIREIRDFATSRGIKFGVLISNVNYGVVSSAKDFYDYSMQWAQIVHSVTPLDEAIIQGWMNYPKNFLPDNSGYSFTQLVKDYAKKYTQPLCTPNCSGKQCGDDGCGGNCGTCPSGTCSNGQCITAQTFPTSLDNYVNHLYTCVLGRIPSQGEINFWKNYLNPKLITFEHVYRMFFNSQEYLLKNTSNDKFVTQSYTCILFRNPSQSELNAWVNALNNKITQIQILNAFLTSNEFLTSIKPKLNALTTCTTNCINKQCGDDGCGGNCGICNTGKACNNGLCLSNQQPIGYFDVLNCNRIAGWSIDPDTPQAPTDINFYMDGLAGTGKPLGNAKANLERTDVCNTLGPQYKTDNTCPHGFDIVTNQLTNYNLLLDGKPHTIYLYATDTSDKTNSQLSTPRTIQCSNNQPTGYFLKTCTPNCVKNITSRIMKFTRNSFLIAS